MGELTFILIGLRRVVQVVNKWVSIWDIRDMANHSGNENREDEFDVEFRIHNREESLKDSVIQAKLVGNHLGVDLSHRDVEVMHDGRFVVATEEEFQVLQELAEKAQYQRFVAEAEAENAEKDRRAKLPEKKRKEIKSRDISQKKTPAPLKGFIFRIYYKQFIFEIIFPHEYAEKRSVSQTSGQTNSQLLFHFSEVCKRFPNHEVTMIRPRDPYRYEKKRQTTLPIFRFFDKDGDLHQPEILDSLQYPEIAKRTKKANIRRVVKSGIDEGTNAKTWVLVLRINMPAGEDASWTCELCGATTDDESVAISISEQSFRTLREFERNQLLTFLQGECRRVADLWEPLTRIASPATSTEVTTEEVVTLLGKTFTLLESEAVRIQLPKELIQGKDKRLTKSVIISSDLSSKPASFKKGAVLRFQAQLAMDGEPLSENELQELAAIRKSLIQLRGKWIYIDSFENQELQKLVERILERSVETISFKDAVFELWFDELQEASGINGIPTSLNAQIPELQQAMNEIRSITPPEVDLPEALHATLRKYQKSGLDWLAMIGHYGLGGCLADDMGLGKTIQTIAWLLHLKVEGITEPALLICPTSVMMNWEKEIRKFAPSIRTYRHHGGKRSDSDLSFFQATNRKDLVITSFNLLHRDQALFRNVSWKWSAVILDEAQNIKNPETEQSKAARSLSEFATNRLALTGTPVENGPRDLWAIMEFLNPGMLGTFKQYVANIASPIEHENDNSHRAKLREKINPFILRRKKTDEGIAPELPEKIEHDHWCFLTSEQAGWYQAALKNAASALNSADQSERRGAILKLLPQLKQICNGVAALQKDGSDIDTRSGKIQTLRDLIVNVVANNEKAIVFSQYPSQFDDLEGFLMDELKAEFGRPEGFAYGVRSLTGKDSIRVREEMQGEFQEQSRYPVMLISLRAGGTGLNLQAANHVFHFDRWWNAAVEDQATDRAWRIGQEKTVHVHKLICCGTLEERIDELIREKKNLANELLGDVDEETLAGQLSKLPNDELFEVLSLKESDAIRED